MRTHPICSIFPDMTAEEYHLLREDIRERGLLEKIWTHDNQIIDGRHRYKACTETKTEPQFREWNGKGSLVEFVVSLNLNRRHLNSSQKAFVALEAEKALGVEAKKNQRLSMGRGKKGRQLIADLNYGARASFMCAPFGIFPKDTIVAIQQSPNLDKT